MASATASSSPKPQTQPGESVHFDLRASNPSSGGDDGRPPVVFVPGVTDVAHDYLEPFNLPCYFHAFVAAAGRNGPPRGRGRP